MLADELLLGFAAEYLQGGGVTVKEALLIQKHHCVASRLVERAVPFFTLSQPLQAAVSRCLRPHPLGDLLLGLLVQPSVLDGDGRLVGQQPQHPQLFLAEGVRLFDKHDVQHAQHPPCPLEGKAGDGLYLPLLRLGRGV